jgi:BirA family transcriptional regulator, biotin operon repressor / biotin---[acetyl-CoA-carboxylase] ligase
MKNWNFIRLASCGSTNDHAKMLKKEKKIADKTAILTDFQEKGKGQGKNQWHSKSKKNLLCSVYCETDLNVEKHFMLNVVSSLSIIETLHEFDIQAKIKWPNDIYIENNKVAGILIENSLVQDTISNTIIGAGININQQKFPGWIPNPVSLSMVTGINYDIEKTFQLYVKHIDKYLNILTSESGSELFSQYLKYMYCYNIWSTYQVHSSNFEGKILGVGTDGKLILETDNGQVCHFDHGEIKFVI